MAVPAPSPHELPAGIVGHIFARLTSHASQRDGYTGCSNQSVGLGGGPNQRV